jgi:hypothetical protein
MKFVGFYIYCIRESENAGNLRREGVEFGGRTQAILFKDIEAIAGEIDLSKFNAKTIKEKLQDDVKWTEKNVKRHHEVIAEAGKQGAVIPMKFGTIYKTKKNLETMLRKYYGKFKMLLRGLRGKQEWGVKGYLDYKKFAEILKKKHREIQKLEEKRKSVPEGMKWYVDKKSDELIAGQIEQGVEEELKRIVDKLEKQTEEIRLNNPLPKEVSEPGKDMILNAACLVKNDAPERFQAAFRELLKEREPMGITLILTGPWPPYNFVEIKLR